MSGRKWDVSLPGLRPRTVEARKAWLHFLNEVDDELTHHRIAIADLRRHVRALQQDRGRGKGQAAEAGMEGHGRHRKAESRSRKPADFSKFASRRDRPNLIRESR